MNLCRHRWIWLPAGQITDHSNGNLLLLDVGKCQKCGAYKSRVDVATPGDQMNAQLGGEKRFKIVRTKREEK